MWSSSDFRTTIFRALLASAACCLSILAFLGISREPVGIQASTAQSSRDANVVLITLDTTRADHLSCYSAHGAKTPHLDALAARGVRFTHATAQVPLTLPSHACIMTGTYPPVNGLRDMGGFILENNHPTVASIARAAGFETAAFVGSRVLSKHFGLSNGFATYDDDMSGQTVEGLPGVFPERRASVVTDRALQWLKKNGGRKFFLWAHYYDPHAPYNPPEPYKRTYAHDLYSGEIANMDEQVGRLLDGISRAGLAGRTLIIVIGDHGESLGEHGEMTHGVFLYDSTLHVPLIVAGPEVHAGKVVENQVRSIDLMPTISEFLHLSPGAEAQGVSLWPLLRGERPIQPSYAYLETLYPRTYMGWSELRAMRTDEWKLIVAPEPELYSLKSDPKETDNVISRFPAVAKTLENKVWEVAGSGAKHERVLTSPIDPDTRQLLQSLGYASPGTTRKIQLGASGPDPKDRAPILKVLAHVEDLLNAKQYPAAAQAMKPGLKLDPANPLGHLYLAIAFERTGEFERAVHVYEEAIQMNARTDQVYARLGKDELRLQHLDKAVSAMARAAGINPTDLDNLRNLGTAYLQLGRVEDAEKAFKANIVQNDHYAAAWNGLGLVAVQREDADSARRNFEKALEFGPDEIEPLLNLGVLYQKAGKCPEAVRYLQRFLRKASQSQYGHLFPDVREAIRGCSGH